MDVQLGSLKCAPNTGVRPSALKPARYRLQAVRIREIFELIAAVLSQLSLGTLGEET